MKDAAKPVGAIGPLFGLPVSEREARVLGASMKASEFREYLAERAAGAKRTKHGNKRTPDPDGGKPFDSKAEADYAGRLRLERMAGRVVSWERQVRLEIAPEGVKLCTYVADFVVLLPDGRRRVVECKGLWTDYAILKAKAFRLYWLPKHPDYDYVVTGAQVRRPKKRGKR